MTLVVAREVKGCIAIAADTQVTMHGGALSMRESVLKSICLRGGTCISFSGSPELAMREIRAFAAAHPNGTGYSETIAYFEQSSATTNNDYIVAFARTSKLVTIRSGRRTSGLARTHWIGDQQAFERFREHEQRARRRHEDGRAVNAALFADEMEGSPASDLYSILRNVTLDRDIPSVGGFVTVLSSRVEGFRFSVYSDVLLDWPTELADGQSLALTDQIDLGASGENLRYSVSQISPGYLDMNVVAFYVLSGRLLVLFYETAEHNTACATIPGVEPSQIAQVLDNAIRFPVRALCLVMSSRQADPVALPRHNPDHGLGLSLYCEVNTMSTAGSGVAAE